MVSVEMTAVIPELVLIAGILGTLMIGAMSPGPSFVLVTRIAIGGGRSDGLAAALGMGTGAALFGALALLGLNFLIAQAPWLCTGLKIGGGLYLLYLAVRIWRDARIPAGRMTEDGSPPPARSAQRAFGLAFLIQVSNPKLAVVYGSVFAAFLPPEIPLWMNIVLPLAFFIMETLWYAVVAIAFSSRHPRAAYLRFKVWIDRAAGAVMGVLGGKLIAEGVAR
ncbi:MAG: LysE family translocator [Alphaproteobacteria bacterium]|nr:LysE family translocator [Alphaproteobacteria bacterium]